MFIPLAAAGADDRVQFPGGADDVENGISIRNWFGQGSPGAVGTGHVINVISAAAEVSVTLLR